MNPYTELDERAFWRTAVANRNLFDIADLWQPRMEISQTDLIATFGSCFAQHFSKALTRNGYSWLCTETAPAGLTTESKKKFNYEVFSCRTGNIYTTSLLRQWVEWALEKKTPPSEYWEKSGRIYDPFRPAVEPDGFASVEEMVASRDHTIRCFRDILATADVFVFTLGLTESWFNGPEGYEYPVCPGTVAGEFDKDKHVFVNQTVRFIRENLNEAISLIRTVNPQMRFLLTVSPVPLTATNSGKHVLVATTASKSALRAVANEIVETPPLLSDLGPSEVPYSIIRNSDFSLGTSGWSVNGSVALNKEGHISIDHDIDNPFSGLKQKLILRPGSDREVSYEIKTLPQPGSVVTAHLSPALMSTKNSIALGTADAENGVISGTAKISWDGDVYLWVGSRSPEGHKSEIVYCRLTQKDDQADRSAALVDYFPSFEIISAPPFKGIFFEPNLREVNPAGVDFVMKSFFACQNKLLPDTAPTQKFAPPPPSKSDLVCEEEILAAFGPGARSPRK